MEPCFLCSSTGTIVEAPKAICYRHGENPCDYCRQLKELDQKVEQSRVSLEQILEERRVLRTKANSYHDPVVNRLPLEISSLIFVFCLPHRPTPTIFSDKRYSTSVDLDYRKPIQFIIGAVCQRWRAIVKATPQLWQILSLDFSSRTPSTRIDLVRAWLERSGQLPLYLRVSLSSGGSWRYMRSIAVKDVLYSIFDLINNSILRANVLLLRLPASLLPSVRTTTQSEARLQTLLLQASDFAAHEDYKCEGAFNLGTPTKASPTTVNISEFVFSAVEINWKNVTSFEAGNLYVSEVLQLLQHAPQLLSFTSRNIESNNSNPIHQSWIITPHDSLQELRVEYSSEGVWDYLMLPSLRKLSIDLLNIQLDSFEDFTTRSQCRIEEFSISQDDRREALDLLRTPSFRSLKSLTILNTDLDEVLLEGLARREGQNTEDGFLLHLECVSLRGGRDFPWSCIPSMLKPPASDHTDGDNSGCRPLRLQNVAFELDCDMTDTIDKKTLHQVLDINKDDTILRIDDLEGTDVILRSLHFHGMVDPVVGIDSIESIESRMNFRTT